MGVPVSGRRPTDDGGGIGIILRVTPAGGFDAGKLVVDFVPSIEIHNTGFRQTEPALGGDDADVPQGLYVTPRDIDRQVRQLGRLLGYGISLALQPGLTAEELAALAE